MRKEHVNIVSARKTDPAGVPLGPIVNFVVCASNEASLHLLFKAQEPNAAIVSTTSLLALEQTALKVRNVLAGLDQSWPLLVEPDL